MRVSKKGWLSRLRGQCRDLEHIAGARAPILQNHEIRAVRRSERMMEAGE